MSPFRSRSLSPAFIIIILVLAALCISYILFLWNDPMRGWASNFSEARGEMRDIETWISHELSASSTTVSVNRLFDRSRAPYLNVIPSSIGVPMHHGNGRIDDPYLRATANSNYQIGVLSNGLWWVQSIGPDRKLSVLDSHLKNWNLLSVTDAEPTVRASTYDPTNGSFSNGDIIRIGSYKAF